MHMEVSRKRRFWLWTIPREFLLYKVSYYANTASSLSTKTTNNFTKVARTHLSGFWGKSVGILWRLQYQTHIFPQHPDSKHSRHTWLSPVLHNFGLYVKNAMEETQHWSLGEHWGFTVEFRFEVDSKMRKVLLYKRQTCQMTIKNVIIRCIEASTIRYPLTHTSHLKGRNRQLGDIS